MSNVKVDKKAVVAALEQISVLLELSGANPFKSRAFQNGARTLQSYEGELREGLDSGEIAKLKGIGKGILTEIQALVRTGGSPALKELQEQVPQGLVELTKIPGLGPKKARSLYEHLQISSLGELEYACNENRLVQLPGFGAKTQEKILRGIEHIRRFAGRYLLDDAWETADRVLARLREHEGVRRIELAGSIRRRKETIKDIDVLVTAEDPMSVAEHFVSMPEVIEVIGHGGTKSSIRLDNGMAVDLRLVKEREFPFALAYFTGSKEHNIRMRQRARERGLTLNEYGLFPLDDDGSGSVKCDSEEDLFEALGLSYVPPELREDAGEFEVIEEGQLPSLIEEEDLRGVLHNHSTWSDGADSIEQMARAARAMGYQYIGLSDHSQSAFYAHGLKPDDVLRQIDEIDQVNEKLTGIHVLKGIESDILPDGQLDYDEDILDRLDFVIASVHGHFGLNQAQQTERCIRAVQNPFATVLGHPTGRLLLAREGFDVDLRAVIDAAAESGCAIELNANPQRLDLDWRELRYAARQGVPISIGPDAHRIDGLRDVRYGIAVARKGWLSAKDVLNHLDLEGLRRHLKERRERRG